MKLKRAWDITKRVAVESVNTAWGLLGLGIAWAVLEPGDTRNVVGTAIGLLTILWVLTVPMRISEGE